MNARDVMVTSVVSVPPHVTARDIARLMLDKHIGAVPVVEDGSPIGMVSDGDLIAKDKPQPWWLHLLAEDDAAAQTDLLCDLKLRQRQAREIMTAPLVTVTEDTDVREMARLLSSHRIKRLPVLRDGRIVGIVSRGDLLRALAVLPEPSPDHHAPSLLSEALMNLDRRFFGASHPAPPAGHSAPPPPAPEASAKEFRQEMEKHEDQLAHQHQEEAKAEVERREKTASDLQKHHVSDEQWQEMVEAARRVAATGGKDHLLLRFPGELCSDGGRAINAPEEDWPQTLRGEAAEVYLRWERDLKPQGFSLSAQVIDFPNGFPGDIGLTLRWGEN